MEANTEDKFDVNHVDQTDGDEHLVPQKTTTASELQDVLLLERPHPWSKNMISLYLILIPAYLCSTTSVRSPHATRHTLFSDLYAETVSTPTLLEDCRHYPPSRLTLIWPWETLKDFWQW